MERPERKLSPEEVADNKWVEGLVDAIGNVKTAEIIFKELDQRDTLYRYLQ